MMTRLQCVLVAVWGAEQAGAEVRSDPRWDSSGLAERHGSWPAPAGGELSMLRSRQRVPASPAWRESEQGLQRPRRPLYKRVAASRAGQPPTASHPRCRVA
eukprot:scaffold346_cov387-Prasinococcus_capsulatus_cf.AAC.33